MMQNIEIFDFFKSYPDDIRIKCIEEVLVLGIRIIKSAYGSKISFPELVEINKANSNNNWNSKVLPVKNKKMVQDTDRMRLVTSRESKENSELSSYNLPLRDKTMKNESAHFQFTLGRSGDYQSRITNESIYCKQGDSTVDEDLEVIKLANEFLKNPFGIMMPVVNSGPRSLDCFQDSNQREYSLYVEF